MKWFVLALFVVLTTTAEASMRQQPEDADPDAEHEQRSRVGAEHADLSKLGQDEAGFAASRMNRRRVGLLSRRRVRCRPQDDEQSEYEPLHHDLPVTLSKLLSAI